MMVDGFSKWPVLAALRNISSYEVCKAIFQKWISVFGSPQNFHSDNGLCFSSSEMAKFCNYFGVKQHFSSPYYPMGNAIVERLIKNVKDALYCTCKEKACDWEEAIPTVEITLPKLTNKSLGLSPYEAVYGRRMFVLSNDKECNTEDHVQEKLLKLAGKGGRDKLKNSLFKPK